MAQRVTKWICPLVIAFFLCGVSRAAQDTAQLPTGTKVTQTSPKGILPAAQAPVSDTAPKNTASQAPSSAVPASPDPGKKAAATKNVSAQAQPAKTPQALPKKKIAGEDISDDEDLILPEKGEDLPVEKAASEAPVKATGTPSEKTAAKPAGDTGRQSVGSLATPVPPSAPAVTTSPPSANSAPAAKPAKTIVIEDARPINFARNLKDYRSPKLAMLLSFCIPGLGQAYIGNKSNYVKAGMYVAVEAAVIGISVYYNNKGNTRYNQAKDFANSNYSVDSMLLYYNQLYNFLRTDPSQNLPDSDAQAKLNDIYIDTITTSTSSFLRSYNNNHPTQDYYHTIENSEYIHGWKGCEPSLAEIGAASDTLTDNPKYHYRYQRGPDSAGNYLVNLIDRKTGKIVPGSDNQLQYGYSPYQRQYITMMSESNNFYKTATYVLFVLLVNHVASAVDALISARAYNEELLGRQTFWQNLSIQPTTAFSGPYLSPGLTMNVRF